MKEDGEIFMWEKILKEELLLEPKASVQETVKAMIEAMYKTLFHEEDIMAHEGGYALMNFMDKEVEERLEPIIGDIIQKIINWEE